MPVMAPAFRKLTLTVHITSSVGWLGAVGRVGMAPFLTGWTRETARDQIGESGLDYLTRIALTYGGTPFTHTMAQLDVPHIKNTASVRDFTNRLIRFGYIRAHSEQLTGRGRPAAQYVVTGAARLVAGIAYTWAPVV